MSDLGPLERNNWITLAVIITLLISVIGLRINVGHGSLSAAGILGLLRAADHGESLRKIPVGRHRDGVAVSRC